MGWYGVLEFVVGAHNLILEDIREGDIYGIQEIRDLSLRVNLLEGEPILLHGLMFLGSGNGR